jgi:hypothetical protein
MAKFPVESNDSDGITDAVNNLLSGPSGLGQFFKGFSDYNDAYLTGNFRPPFTQPTLSNLYVAPILLDTNEMLDGNTWKFTFDSTQASVPFSLGTPITIYGSTSDYNGTYSPIGVVECTTDYVICRTQTAYPIVSPVTGGYATYTSTVVDVDPTLYSYISTDCNAKVIVNGATDRVFVSAQLNNIISFISTGDSDFDYTVAINRLVGTPTSDPTNPEYRFNPDATISRKTYHYFGLNSGTNPLDNIETIFSTVIDQPVPGYYWYILEVSFNTISGDLQVTDNLLALRSLSAQVVKQ